MIGLLLALSIGVSAPQPVPANASYVRSEDFRVGRVGYRIGVAGVRFCPQPHPLTGLMLHHLAEYRNADREAAIDQYALDRGPAVLAVVPGSAAAQAGLMAGDVVLAVNGQSVSSASSMTPPDDSRQARREIEATERRLEQSVAQHPVRLSVLRRGQALELRLGSKRGCPARVRLARSRQMNAFANRGYAIITTALLDFVRSDDELAIILGHEIAHIVLRHPETLEADGVPKSGLLRHFGKNAAKVRLTEEEADRLGLKLAWAAGYDISAALPFWRRYSAKVGPRLRTTHPGLKAREKLIADTIAELGASNLGSQAPQLGESALPQR